MTFGTGDPYCGRCGNHVPVAEFSGGLCKACRTAQAKEFLEVTEEEEMAWKEKSCKECERLRGKLNAIAELLRL